MIRLQIPGLVCAALLLGAALGCGDGGAAARSGPADGEEGGPPTFHRDIKPLVEAKCGNCHVAGGIAPFALQSYEEVQAHAGVAMLAIDQGIMPPWPPDPDCAEYTGNRSLSAEQKELFRRWLEAGTPEGDAESPGEALPGGESTMGRVDLTLRMPEPYVPGKAPDDYRCFLVPWPEEIKGSRFVTGFRAVPGNRATVHHVIAFVATQAQVPMYQQLDAAEPGPGYTCFGGTGGPSSQWLGAWAPGDAGYALPAGTGIEVPAKGMLIVQVHYNTSAGAGADQSALELQIAEQVERPAFVVPFADPAWVNERKMVIPAGQKDVVHRFSIDPADITRGRTFDIHMAGLHMHTRGVSGRLAVERPGGEECLLDIPRWDFDWQGAYAFTQARAFTAGDKLSIECHWDNSAENQPSIDGQPQVPRELNWGEGTGDEMCLGVFLVSRRP